MKKTSAALILDGFQVLELLGEGGAGSVFKARQESTGQLVALKFLHADPAHTAFQRQRLIARFERETRLCAQLHHPHIVRLLDQGHTAAQELYAVYEFVPGITLKEWLLRHGPLQPQVAGEIMAQLLDALACAHAQGIVHRDLKPQNIMLSDTGASLHTKILDFGIAAMVPEMQQGGLHASSASLDAMGTPSYSAPEQLRGEPATTCTDLYAWGLVLLECLTGRAAISGATLAEIFHKQLSPQEIALPPAIAHHPLGILLRRVLQKDSHERAHDARSLYAELRAMPLANIVGDLQQTQLPANTGLRTQPQLTLDYLPGVPVTNLEQRQITVLCCSMAVAPLDQTEVKLDALEALEALQRDQLHLCSATCQRHGAYLAGSLGDSQMYYFGYPQVHQDDAQRAARTALDLIAQVRRRSRLLEQQQGVRLEICIAIHTGMVLARPGHPPHGLTPDIALRQNRMAKPGTVLVSSDSRRLLEAGFELTDSGMRLQGMPISLLTGEYCADAFCFLRTRASHTDYIGQHARLAMLHRLWQRTRQGHGHSALIVAEAGIGKSRLAYEQCHLVRQQGCLTREARCLPEHKNDALYPFLRLLKTHYHLHDEGEPLLATRRLQAALEASECETAHALPILCSWLALPLPPQATMPTFSASRQKRILLQTLQKLILHIGSGAPFLLVLEDIHWIDQTSFELLSRLIKEAPHYPLLLILTSRPEFAARWNPHFLEIIKLPRLTKAETALMLSNLLGPRPLAERDLQQLVARTNGVPLFAEELVHMLQEQKALVAGNGVWHLLPGSANSSQIPASLHAFLGERLGMLGRARETAQLAAAIGREFSHELLLNASLSDEASIQTALDQMISARLICRQRRVHGDLYIFRHALIRDAAYESIPVHLRRHVHARIAFAMESLPAAEIEPHLAQLAGHFAQALDFAKAIQYGKRAEQQALTRALAADAMRHANHVQLWQAQLHASGHAFEHVDIYQMVSEALMLKYGWLDTRLAPVSNRARTARGKRVSPCWLLESLHSIEQATPLQWAMATYHHVASNRGTVRELTDQLQALSNQSNDRSLLKF